MQRHVQPGMHLCRRDSGTGTYMNAAASAGACRAWRGATQGPRQGNAARGAQHEAELPSGAEGEVVPRQQRLIRRVPEDDVMLCVPCTRQLLQYQSRNSFAVTHHFDRALT